MKVEMEDIDDTTICDSVSSLIEGCRLPVHMKGTDDWPLAEIISIKDNQGKRQYYVHYVDFNKRLDEWVTEESLDTRKVHFPRRDGGSNTGVSTPKKLHIGAGGSVSRPSSPVSNSGELVNGSAVLAAALRKTIHNKKRKLPSMESEDSLDAPPSLPYTPHTPQMPLTPHTPQSQQQPTQNQNQTPTTQPPPGPRQSGSMVSHHDDVITRMKNVDMIELGRHRIKPWYFAPYPQCACSVLELA